jgi:hypothetical protein
MGYLEEERQGNSGKEEVTRRGKGTEGAASGEKGKIRERRE